MSKHITTEMIEIAAFTAKCTGEGYCVATSRSGNTITITSTVPVHTGKIELDVDAFSAALEAIRNADPTEINPLNGAGVALTLTLTGDEDSTYTMTGPGGDTVRFYAHELSSFYTGVRAGEFSKLMLDTVAVPA